VDPIAAAREASGFALAILKRRGRKLQNERVVQADKLREVLGDPFPDAAGR